MFMSMHNSLEHGIIEYEDEFFGSKIGEGWLKHLMHGLHCVHIKSLPVSTMAEKGFGGVPMDKFMRNSPSPG